MSSEVVSAIFIPFLALVIVEMSGISRNIDLLDMHSADLMAIFPLFWKADGSFFGIPRWGRFNFIHTTNVVAILYGEYIVLEVVPASAVISVTVLWALLMIFPILEVNEYDILLKESVTPKSIYFHIISGSIAIIYTGVWVLLWKDSTIATGIWSGIFMMTVAIFPISLSREFDELNDCEYIR